MLLAGNFDVGDHGPSGPIRCRPARLRWDVSATDPAVRGAAAPTSGQAGPQGRLPYLDNVKVLLIAAIIAMHAVLSYAALEAWTYTEFREVTLTPVVERVLLVLVLPFGLFVISLLFLVAGLLTRPSLERKGPARFARDRLVRLGVPFGVYVLLVQPTVVHLLARSLGRASGPWWHEVLGDEQRLDTGPLWFVGVLLVLSLACAGWTALGRRHPRRGGPIGPIRARHLVVATLLVVPASFLVRLAYPYGGEAGFTDLNLWQWPACAAVFTLGFLAAGQGWLDDVPIRLRRQCRAITLVAVAAMVVLLVAAGMTDRVDALMGGWTAAAAAFALVEGTLNVAGPVWLLGAAQQHLARPQRWAPPVVSRSAYGAFIVQTPVLVGLAVLIRPLPMPAELKAVVLVVAGVALSFAVARLLLRHVPGLSRVL